MKRPLRISLVIFGVLVLMAVAWVVLGVYYMMGIRSQAPERVYSPDGSKVIIPMIDSNKDNHDTYLLVYLEVQDTQSEETLFEVQTRASDRMRWSVEWIDNSTVKLNSSDIGSYCWVEDKSDVWMEIQCP